MNRQEEILIYTDGGCKGNPGPGGWAFVLLHGSQVLRKSGALNPTTNNQMELTAVIEGLKQASELDPEGSRKAIVVTDSQYVKNGITKWIHGWKRNGWRTASKSPVKNKDFWVALDSLDSVRETEWKWVKGHAGDPLNEECDRMVGEAIEAARS